MQQICALIEPIFKKVCRRAARQDLPTVAKRSYVGSMTTKIDV